MESAFFGFGCFMAQKQLGQDYGGIMHGFGKMKCFEVKTVLYSYIQPPMSFLSHRLVTL